MLKQARSAGLVRLRERGGRRGELLRELWAAHDLHDLVFMRTIGWRGEDNGNGPRTA